MLDVLLYYMNHVKVQYAQFDLQDPLMSSKPKLDYLVLNVRQYARMLLYV